MNLESLANELLLDLFEYMSDAHLIRAFYNLNFRFNNLLLTHFYTSGRLDFRSVSKHDFDIIFQEYVPFISDHITALRLSNDGETPQQIDYILSRGLTLHQFTHLTSLSLHHFSFDQGMKEIMTAWNYLPQLTHLSIVQCQCFNNSTNILCILNNIWSLRKLSSCHLDINYTVNRLFLFQPTVISSSLRCLSIQGLYCTISELNHIFEHTPRLSYLDICIRENFDFQQLTSHIPQITKLKLAFRGSINILTNLLGNMPNVKHLTNDTEYIHLDGREWQDIVSNHLPNLKVLQLRMQFGFNITRYCESELDVLLDTYRTPFWLEEQKWFVRCHLYLGKYSYNLCLYTLPYTFVDFRTNPDDKFILLESTCSSYCDQNLYNHVHNLSYGSAIFSGLDMSAIRFFNIQHLSLELPLHDELWTIAPTLTQLHSLYISIPSHLICTEDIQHQLQILFDRAPHLYSLAFISTVNPRPVLLQNMNASVRRLDFHRFNHYFSDTECDALIESSLGVQCEVLLIKIEDHKCIPKFVKKMTNLRALNVQCCDARYKSDVLFMAWLKRYLPSNNNIVKQDKSEVNNIRLWLR